MSDQSRRRSPRPRKSKGAQPQQPVSPEERFRAQLEGAYLDRQMRWHSQLKATDPDWNVLLGIHLQMSELERMFAGLEKM